MKLPKKLYARINKEGQNEFIEAVEIDSIDLFNHEDLVGVYELIETRVLARKVELLKR